nr:MAG TPA: hypothetical protein [Caudoviricetes sp.]
MRTHDIQITANQIHIVLIGTQLGVGSRKENSMELIFADATKIQIQSAQETGGKLEIKVIQVAPAQLRELFTDPVKTKIMRITEREQNIAEYEGYTEFYRTEEYTGGIYGVAMEKAGKTTAERLAEVETENAELKEALVNANTQITDLQGAICELYEMGVQK